MHLCAVAAQAGQRAGIAFALGGLQLRLIAVAEPEFCLQIGGLAQRRRVGDLLDDPAGALQPLAGIGNGGLHFRHGIEAVRVEAQRDALGHRRPFQRRRHPPGIAMIARRHRGQRDPDIADGARQRPRDRADLRPDRPLRQRRVEGRDAAHGRPQAVHAAGIGGIADRARDIGAVRDMADAGRDRRTRAAGRAARRDAGVARVLGVAMDEVGGEPAIGEGRAIGAPQNHGAGFAQIVDHRVVALGDGVALQLQPVGGGKAFLVDIDLHRDRHAAERTGVFAARDGGIDGGSLRQHVLRPVVDHGVDFGVDRVQPRQRRGRRLLGRDFLRPDQRGHFRGRQTP